MFADFRMVSLRSLWRQHKPSTVAAWSAVERPLVLPDRLECAGVEAALRRIGLDAPGWQLRRLEWDDEWRCTLTLYQNMPDAFDDAVDGSGLLLPLAILDAIENARCRRQLGGAIHPGRRQDLPGGAASCDNIY